MLQLSTMLLAMTVAQPSWHEDYDKATDAAIAEKKDLVLYLHRDDELSTVFNNAEVKEKLKGFVCLKLPLDFKVGDKRLVDYPALEDMMGKPGIAVISYQDKKLPTFATAISCHPLVGSRYRWAPAYGPEQVKIILDLPSYATLSQRSMIYAIRVHPEVPQSVYCTCHPAFLEHAERHSRTQASSLRQHHANLGFVMGSLRSKVERGFSGAQEVVAESWGTVVGGENVLEAAFSCIDAWRGSPGHWGAVSGRHLYFGYDIARGSNGKWFATGIFGH